MKKIFHDVVYRSIVEKSSDGVVIINRNGDIISWNMAAEKIFGYTQSEVLGHYVHDILPATHLREKAHKAFCKFKQTGSGPLIGKQLQVEGLKKNGDIVHVLFSPNVIEVKGELFVFAFIRDISNIMSLQDKLARLATTDELTNILNRRAFFQLAEPAFAMSKRHEEPFSLLMIDIDFFKRINDQYGHLTGDIALKTCTQNISRMIRQEDIFGRIGGEEFCLAMVKTRQEVALQLAERIRHETENLTIKTPEAQFKLTVSIGVATLLPEDHSLLVLQGRSDKALYQAKDTGRNRVVCV